jgi:hypothetical protein
LVVELQEASRDFRIERVILAFISAVSQRCMVLQPSNMGDGSSARSFGAGLSTSGAVFGVSRRPVSIAVARRKRHSRLASRSTSSRSTAVSASKPAATAVLELLVIFGILQRTDHRLCGEAMADGVTAGMLFAFFRNWASAFPSIKPVGFNLPERSH